MIYLDNAATTYPKPPQVYNAMTKAMKKYGANPGRSGHKMSMESALEIYECRRVAAKMFNAPGEECVAFTLNCTHATNMVLKGLLKPGDNVVTSCLEHNAIMRPLKKLEERGVTHTTAKVYPGDNDKTVDSFRKCITSKTALIVCTCASNVWGIKLPIERIAALAKVYGIPMMVDAAQGAGLVELDMEKYNIDYLCLAGHKGLYGPMGTGMLIASSANRLNTIIEGGTGTNSLSYYQPSDMPEKLESGTPNIIGIAGLRAGMEYVDRMGIEKIRDHESKLMTYFYDRVEKMKHVELYMPRPDKKYFAPVVSFNIKGKDSESVGNILDSNGIEVRSGLHCAPAAHKFAGTLERGAVRVCPSVFTSQGEIDRLVNVIQKMS